MALTANQKLVAYKYVVRYPQFATLAKRAETDPRAAKALGDAMMDLEYPHDLTPAEAIEVAKIGLTQEETRALSVAIDVADKYGVL